MEGVKWQRNAKLIWIVIRKSLLKNNNIQLSEGRDVSDIGLIEIVDGFDDKAEDVNRL